MLIWECANWNKPKAKSARMNVIVKRDWRMGKSPLRNLLMQIANAKRIVGAIFDGVKRLSLSDEARLDRTIGL